MGLRSYYGAVWARAWRDTAMFVKTEVVIGLAVGVVAAIVTGRESAELGEAFNERLAIYALVVGSAVTVIFFLVCHLAAAPWRLYREQAALTETQAARIAEIERRPDVRPLVALRERGVHLLNRPVSQSEDQLADWSATLRAWEDDTAAELEKCATKTDVSEFRVLGTFAPRVFPGVITVHKAEMTRLAERLERLSATIRRIEGGVFIKEDSR